MSSVPSELILQYQAKKCFKDIIQILILFQGQKIIHLRFRNSTWTFWIGKQCAITPLDNQPFEL